MTYRNSTRQDQGWLQPMRAIVEATERPAWAQTTTDLMAREQADLDARRAWEAEYEARQAERAEALGGADYARFNARHAAGREARIAAIERRNAQRDAAEGDAIASMTSRRIDSGFPVHAGGGAGLGLHIDPDSGFNYECADCASGCDIDHNGRAAGGPCAACQEAFEQYEMAQDICLDARAEAMREAAR